MKIVALLALALTLVLAPLTRADVRFPPRPAEEDFVLDQAQLLTQHDTAYIRQVSAALLQDKGFPIIVVTIPSLADYGAGGEGIEKYAKELFNTWGIGRPEINRGMLLLVAKNDHKARIQIGADWDRQADAVCQDVMNSQIIPNFKAGRFSEGITSGVVALDKMGRGQPIRSAASSSPSAGQTLANSGQSLWGTLGWLLLLPVLIIVALIRSLIRKLRSGTWFPPNSTRSSGSFYDSGFGGDSGGGGGGGSFGGGSSSGGGASGSW